MDAGPGCIRTEPTTPPGGGVPTGSGTTSAAFTQTAEFFESCRRAWSFQRPESTAVVPVGKNQLYVPPGTDFPTVRLSVVPACAVSSLSTTTVGNASSMGPTVSGHGAVAVSCPTTAPSVAQAPLPSGHGGAAAGRGAQALHAPLARSGTGVRPTVRLSRPTPPRTAPNRKVESRA